MQTLIPEVLGPSVRQGRQEMAGWPASLLDRSGHRAAELYRRGQASTGGRSHPHHAGRRRHRLRSGSCGRLSDRRDFDNGRGAKPGRARCGQAGQLCSDLPTSPRLAYVGIDHYSAGRTAAYFMTRMARRPGPVIVLTHCLDYRAHAQRIGGFRDWLSEHKADVSVACILEGRDAPDLSERLLIEALLGHADAIGIYNTRRRWRSRCE